MGWGRAMGVVGLLCFGMWLPALAFAAGEGSPVVIDYLGQGVRVAGFLMLLIVVAALVVRFGKRFQPGLGGGGPIQVMDGRNLAPGVGVRLVKVGEQAWLIGVTRDRISMLAEVSGKELAPPEEVTR
ncbi:MAG: flagellar biosynthetic protein FliO [Magnetococcales bacterium]|nr:flagellar biosynthetic protein FliO [Magnetococcales bacterium]